LQKKSGTLPGNPVGMIATYKGATPAQAWISISGLEKDAALAHYVSDHQRRIDNLTNARLFIPKNTLTTKAR